MLASQARLVISIGGKYPSQTRDRARRRRKNRQTSKTEYMLELDAVRDVLGAYDKGIQTHAFEADKSGAWEPLGDGAHMRATLLDGEIVNGDEYEVLDSRMPESGA